MNELMEGENVLSLREQLANELGEDRIHALKQLIAIEPLLQQQIQKCNTPDNQWRSFLDCVVHIKTALNEPELFEPRPSLDQLILIIRSNASQLRHINELLNDPQTRADFFDLEKPNGLGTPIEAETIKETAELITDLDDTEIEQAEPLSDIFEEGLRAQGPEEVRGIEFHEPKPPFVIGKLETEDRHIQSSVFVLGYYNLQSNGLLKRAETSYSAQELPNLDQLGSRQHEVETDTTVPVTSMNPTGTVSLAVPVGYKIIGINLPSSQITLERSEYGS